jgi:hypothetical protein
MGVDGEIAGLRDRARAAQFVRVCHSPILPELERLRRQVAATGRLFEESPNLVVQRAPPTISFQVSRGGLVRMIEFGHD